MPKKKGRKFGNNQDFTINDSANAPTPVNRVKKSAVEKPTEATWDDLADDFDIVEELNEDGTTNLIYKKKNSQISQSETEDATPGCFYPEIVWYLISLYVQPEDVCRFALINKTTYAITKRESFWRNLYKKHCDSHPKLPARLRLENSFTTYCLRQRVIRALYYTHNVFLKNTANQERQELIESHLLIKRRCINIWYQKCSKSPSYWLLYFKLKRNTLHNGMRNKVSRDILTELGRVDANPDEDCKVMEVTCKSGTFQNGISPLMGMTLSTVTLVLSQGFMDHKLRLGFNSGAHNISRNILPECSIVIDKVIKVSVYDWWHVKYPFNNRLPAKDDDDEALPMLKEDFFKMTERDF